MSDLAQAAIGAILDADDPKEVRAIRDVLRCGDMTPDEPDEDEAPVDKGAASRVQQWLQSRSIKRTTEAVQPNKTGPGCHNTETGHPAPCPGSQENQATDKASDTGTTPAEVEGWVEQHYGDWIKSLRKTPEGKAAKQSAASYCGNFYRAINALLRDPEAKNSYTQQLTTNREAAAAHTKNLDALFASVPPLPQDLSVFRGVYGPFAETVKGLKPGDELSDKGYVSTTPLESHSREHFIKDGGVMFQIHIARGSNVLPLTHFSDKQEGELLLPRGSRFRVLKNDGAVIHLELLAPGNGDTSESVLLAEAVASSGNRFLWGDGDVTITQGSSEACIHNKTGDGFHDEKGHPCSPGPRDAASLDRAAKDADEKGKRVRDYSSSHGPATKEIKAASRYRDVARRRRVIHAVKNEGLLADAISGFNLPDSEPADVVHVTDAAGKVIRERDAIRAVLSRREMLTDELRKRELTPERKALVLNALESEQVHFFEVKTLLTSPHGAVHMTAKAKARKERWERKYHAAFHVVAVDDRKGGKHSGHRVYVAPGELAGTFRIDKMQKAESLESVLKMVGGQA